MHNSRTAIAYHHQPAPPAEGAVGVGEFLAAVVDAEMGTEFAVAEVVQCWKACMAYPVEGDRV
jgi:hypothetical protein